MNDSKRKELRTQGRFKSENQDGSYQKRSRGPYSGRSYRKNSPQEDASPTHKSYASNHDVKWDDEIDGHFSKLDERPVAKVIRDPGFRVLSNTENGESRIYFEPDFIPPEKSSEFLQKLHKNVEWNKKNIVIHGQEYPQPRLVAWYGPLPYTYSGVTLKPREFPDLILKIKKQVESSLRKQHINVELNSVLLNLYRDGKDSVAWHSDDELSMGISPTIASVSLGETRRFEMRHKTDDPRSRADAEYVVHLTSGSLIVMDGVMQQDWQHRVPKEFHDKSKRINLTFRTVYPLEQVSRPLRGYLSEVPEDLATTFAPKIKEEPFEFQEESFPSLGESIPQQTKGVSSKSESYNTTYQKIDPPRKKQEKDTLCNNNGTSGSWNNDDSQKNEDLNTQVCQYDGIWDDGNDPGNTYEEKTRTSQLKERGDSRTNIKKYESIPQQTKGISSKSKSYNTTYQKIDPPRKKRERDSLYSSNNTDSGSNNNDRHKNEYEDWNTQVCKHEGTWGDENDSSVTHEERTRTPQLRGSEDSCKNIKNYREDLLYYHNNHRHNVSSWNNQKYRNSGTWENGESDSSVDCRSKKDAGVEKSIGGSYVNVDSHAEVPLDQNCSRRVVEPYDSSKNLEQVSESLPKLNIDESGYEGDKMNSVHQQNKNTEDSRTATSDEITCNSQGEEVSTNCDPSFPKVPKGEILENFAGKCYWYPPLEVTDSYRTECQKLKDIYQYVYTNWHDIPLGVRERKELEVLLTVIDESGPLRLKALKAVVNEMSYIIENAEWRATRNYVPRNDQQFYVRRSYYNTSKYKQYYNERY